MQYVEAIFAKASLVTQKVENRPAMQQTGSIPGLERSPGERSSYPLQCSSLGNPMDRGAWWAIVYAVAKSQTQPNICKGGHKGLLWGGEVSLEWWEWASLGMDSAEGTVSAKALKWEQVWSVLGAARRLAWLELSERSRYSWRDRWETGSCKSWKGVWVLFYVSRSDFSHLKNKITVAAWWVLNYGLSSLETKCKNPHGMHQGVTADLESNGWM